MKRAEIPFKTPHKYTSLDLRVVLTLAVGILTKLTVLKGIKVVVVKLATSPPKYKSKPSSPLNTTVLPEKPTESVDLAEYTKRRENHQPNPRCAFNGAIGNHAVLKSEPEPCGKFSGIANLMFHPGGGSASRFGAHSSFAIM